MSPLIQKQLARKAELHCTFLDLSKAFDSVDHKLLWNKLHRIGLNTKIIKTMSSLYSKMEIYLENALPISLKKGVLQGNCLSPTLLNLFFSDLALPSTYGVSLMHSKTEITHQMLADDLVFIADNHLYLQKSINIMSKYLADNGLSVNINKTLKIVFSNHPRRKRESVYIDKKAIESVTQIKYLGLDFHSNGKRKRTTNSRIDMGIQSVYHLASTNENELSQYSARF